MSHSRPRRIRSMGEFARQEIVLPSGPSANLRFHPDRQPYNRLWLELIDSGHWTRFAATGPTQSGKTVCAFLIPLLYHLFEVGETVVCGIPDLAMAADKWREDIEPIIERTRYRELLPIAGGGSRGGKVLALRFRHGATLRFMSGGSRDKARAGFSTRVVVISETDGMDQPSAGSREGDKIRQIEGRTRAHGSRRRVYLECTASVAEGRIWQEFQNGTATRILLPCPLCEHWVQPEREHLTGWQDAPDEITARERAAFCCPACGKSWTEPQRYQANLHARVIHRGQEMGPDGAIHGTPTPTSTLGFRWSAVNNTFVTAGDVAADEWRAVRAADENNAEREMRQYVWCLPYEPPVWDTIALDSKAIVQRREQWPKGMLPADTAYFTVGVDLGKRVGWYLCLALRCNGAVHVPDYGSFDIQSDDFAVELATIKGLRDFHDLVQTGWPVHGSAKLYCPDLVLIDAGWLPEVVHQFVREQRAQQRLCYFPAVGRGASQQRTQLYLRPKRTNSEVARIGEGWHLVRIPKLAMQQFVLDADHWKTWIHERLSTPVGQAGAMTFYQGTDREHIKLSKHLTAEKQVTEFVGGRGTVTRWERISRTNHWFDCSYLAAAAGAYLGFRLLGPAEPPAPKPMTLSEWFGKRK